MIHLVENLVWVVLLHEVLMLKFLPLGTLIVLLVWVRVVVLAPVVPKVVVLVQRWVGAVVVSMSVLALAGQCVVGLVTTFWGLYQNQVVVVVLVRSLS